METTNVATIIYDMKKHAIILGILLPFITTASAQRMQPVDARSSVKFKVSHQMIFKSTVEGSFTGLKGFIIFDPKNLSESTFDVSIKAASVNTGIGMRDNDIKKEKYFNTDKFPDINIKSKKISKGDRDNEYVLNGELTIKGRTLPVTFSFTAAPSKTGIIFKGDFHINRLDFNIGPDNSISKDVEIDLMVNAE